jgi:hypothetical protein
MSEKNTVMFQYEIRKCLKYFRTIQLVVVALYLDFISSSRHWATKYWLQFRIESAVWKLLMEQINSNVDPLFSPPVVSRLILCTSHSSVCMDWSVACCDPESIMTQWMFRQFVGRIAIGIGPSQAISRPLPTQDNTTQKNAVTNPCLELYSNPRSEYQGSSRLHMS